MVGAGCAWHRRTGLVAALALILSAGLGIAETSADSMALGREVLPGPVPVEIVRVIDGDTIAVRAHTWLGAFVETRVRLEGIDAPERHGRCADETALAEQARQYLELLLTGAQVRLFEIRNDKYGGRVRAKVITSDGTDVSEAMVLAGLARRYHGERRGSWCLPTG